MSCISFIGPNARVFPPGMLESADTTVYFGWKSLDPRAGSRRAIDAKSAIDREWIAPGSAWPERFHGRRIKEGTTTTDECLPFCMPGGLSNNPSVHGIVGRVAQPLHCSVERSLA